MKRISVLALSLSLWGWGYEVAIAAQPSLGSSFREWCLQRTDLSASSRKTVEVLLKKAGTSNCSQADEILSSLTELNLNFNQITDVSPLSSLSNLTELNLGGNQITDVSPLSGLTNLTELELKNNPIAQPTCPVSPSNVCFF
ncbi:MULTISPECIES: leucine-rich repeat domain-containing protein [unclassified Coleofasciculus]|uniref:leucine-rich repeat domain-containing protein n=1 Tax=unclassified Coleofasciculus TaxID=2692782 RepID=UPI0018809713|nr:MULTISPECIES: leucine-rich repeat domain-containing protein [unclassified Coleofasciculus]MBE9125624.1 leucine-rich repeat domain-containing protein [Coleofasciculus sp. LEGE 07081]MBE9147338.1 leucine-rich repeat domain-containing protein [Coleofasciculus sp. LEGE 07092]